MINENHIPTGWQLHDLPQLLFFQEGPGVRNWQFTDSGVKLLNVRNLVKGKLQLDNTVRFLSEEEAFGKYNHFLAEAGDLVMATSGATWGKTAWVEEQHLPLCMNTSTVRFRPRDSEQVNLNYMEKFLTSVFFTRQIDRLVTGSAQPNFGPSHLAQVKIPLPSLPEQKRIADILDKAESIRRKRREAIGLAEQFVRSTFLEMFGDPVSNPMQWPVNKLQDMSTLIGSGSTPKGGKRVYVAEGITFFRSQNVWRNRLAFDDIAYIDEETHRKLAKSSLKKRDILITKTGRFNTENSSLGRAAIFMGQDDSANVNGHVYFVRLEEQAIHKFVLFILTMDEYREYIRSVCVGGIDKRQINKEHLEMFPIISPPRDLQLRFAEIVKSVERQTARMRTHFAEADDLFNSLVQRAFKGDL